MQQIIAQNQTAVPLPFLMVQSVDHISPLTGAAPTVVLSKNGAAFASPAGAVAEIGNGWYKVAPNATDANTLGPLLLHATASGADPADAVFEVGPIPATDTSGNALATAAALATLASEVTGSGAGPIAINQNTGGADNLRYVNSNGQGIGDANILIYLATDWPGNPGNVQAAAVTGPDGRWLAPAFVSHGTYVAVFTRIGLDGPDVSAPFTV